MSFPRCALRKVSFDHPLSDQWRASRAWKILGISAFEAQ